MDARDSDILEPGQSFDVRAVVIALGADGLAVEDVPVEGHHFPPIVGNEIGVCVSNSAFGFLGHGNDDSRRARNFQSDSGGRGRMRVIN